MHGASAGRRGEGPHADWMPRRSCRMAVTEAPAALGPPRLRRPGRLPQARRRLHEELT